MHVMQLLKVFTSALLLNACWLTAQANTDLVGNFSGELTVDQGQATYRISLELAPAAGDFAPELALRYDSSAGNGLLGMGWSIEGLSAISRCPRTIAQDGARGGIAYDANDRFCLDGQRLVAIQGTYGANGTEYRTEINHHSKIVSYGQQGSGPAYWQVWTKDGRILTFGQNTDAQHIGQNQSSVHTWNLQTIADRSGNTINLVYHNTNQEVYLQEVHYTGGKVLFQYENRSDTQTNYHAGGVLIRVNQRLAKVEVWNAVVLLREYRLGYEAENNEHATASRIIQIKKCGHTHYCLPELNLKWMNDDLFTDRLFDSYLENDGSSTSTTRFYFYDFNGDGLTDNVYWNPGYNNNGRNGPLRVRLGKGDGTFGPYTEMDGSSSGTTRFYFYDFNGDGLTDNVYWNPGYISNGRKGPLRVRLGKGDGTFGPYTEMDGSSSGTTRFYFHDFNGDGLTDNVYWNPGYSSNGRKGPLRVRLGKGDGTFGPYIDSDGSGTGVTRFYFYDFNGDGLTDNVYWNPWYNNNGRRGPLRVRLGKGDGTFGPYTEIDGSGTDTTRFYFHDFNGDGLTDNVYWNPGYSNNGRKGPLRVRLSKGDGTFGPYIDSDGSGTGVTRFYFYDFNGDGLTDNVYWNPWYNNNGRNGPLRVRLGKGDGTFGPYTEIDGSGTDTTRFYFYDFNGDGLTDNVYWNPGYSNNGRNGPLRMRINNHKYGYISEMDSDGNRLSVDYSPIAAYLNYKKMSYSLYPTLDLQNATHVVSQVKRSNGIGGFNTTDYQYGGLKANMHGRGSLGFQWIKAIQAENNKTIYTEYNQGFPLTGTVKTHTEGIGDTIISRTDYQYTTDQANGLAQVALNRKTETTYELNGQLVSQQLTETTHDAFANPTTIQQTKTAGGQSYTETTTTQYLNDTARWLLGKPVGVQVIYNDSDHTTPDITRHSVFSYDANTGLRKSKTTEPNSSLRHKTEYFYDNYGNTIRVKKIAAGQERISHTAYDTQGIYVTRRTNPLNHGEAYTYDLYGNLISNIGPNKLSTHWQYDSLGRTIREIRADGTETLTEYTWDDSVANAVYRVTTSISGQAPTAKIYDHLDRPIREIMTGYDGKIIFRDMIYDRYGRISKQSLPYYQGDQVYWLQFAYDALGRKITSQRPAGDGVNVYTSSIEYAGLTQTQIDAKGKPKTITNNALGLPVKIVDAAGGVLQYRYDAKGNLLETIDVANNSTRLTYDLYDNRIAINDPNLGRWTYQYNAFGELIQQQDAKGQVMTMAYDKLGRMISRNEPEGTSTWQYDNTAKAIGKLTKVTAPGYVKTYTYDVLGRAKTTTQSAADKILSLTNYYDAYSRVVRRDHPEGFKLVYVYNQSGYLEKIKTPIRVLDGYDPVHLEKIKRETLITAEILLAEIEDYLELALEYRNLAASYQVQLDQLIADGQFTDTTALRQEIIAKLTTAQGQLQNNEAVRTAASTIESAQWLLNNLIQAHQQQIVLAESIDVLQQSAGKLEDAATRNITLVQENLELYYNPELVDELKEQAEYYNEDANDPGYITYWHAHRYDAAGRLTSFVLGNGLVTDRDYNPAGQLEHIRTGFNYETPVRELDYNYDANNNVVARYNQALGISSQFVYDTLDRLVQSQTSASTGSTAESWTYDAQGNMTAHNGQGYSYDAGRPHAVTNAGDTNYAYDANGNIISKRTNEGDTSIQWTSFNKPQTFISAQGTTGFVYGPERKRYLKTLADGSTTVYLDKAYEQVTDSSGNITHKYFIYAEGKLLAMHIHNVASGSQQIRYLHRDNLDSVDTITDGTGKIVQRASYDPFGERQVVDQQSNLTDAFTKRGFTGHEHIAELNLIHMNGRVYDPVIGRFLSPDKYIQDPGNSQNYNRYAYVLNNPLKYTDPSGDFVCGGLCMAIVISAAVNATIEAVVAGIESDWDPDTMLKGAVKGAITGAVTGAIGFYAAPYVAGVSGLKLATVKKSGYLVTMTNASWKISSAEAKENNNATQTNISNSEAALQGINTDDEIHRTIQPEEFILLEGVVGSSQELLQIDKIYEDFLTSAASALAMEGLSNTTRNDANANTEEDEDADSGSYKKKLDNDDDASDTKNSI